MSLRAFKAGDALLDAACARCIEDQIEDCGAVTQYFRATSHRNVPSIARCRLHRLELHASDLLLFTSSYASLSL